jgi:Putative peptidoglycan binding domain
LSVPATAAFCSRWLVSEATYGFPGVIDGEIRMRQIAIALLATTMIGTPVFAASQNQQQPKQQQTNQNQQANQQQAQGNQQGNQTSQNLSRREIRQAQQALNKDGFKVGRADGRLGPETENAIKQFQQSKQIQPSGQLDQQTMADLGLDTSGNAPGAQGQQK